MQTSSAQRRISEDLWENVSVYRRASDFPGRNMGGAVSSRSNHPSATNTSNTADHRASLVGIYPVVQITHPGLNLVHEYILKALAKPRADHEIVEIFNNFKWAPKASDQHIRTSRNELVKRGLVEWTGEYRKTSNNVRAKVWKSTRTQES